MTYQLVIAIREMVRDSGEYEFRIKNIGDRRLTNLRFYYGEVLGPSRWYDDTHLGFSDKDIPPWAIPSLDPQQELTMVTRLWGTLRQYAKNNSRPVWSRVVGVMVDGQVESFGKSYRVDRAVQASLTIEKPTYVTFTYGDGCGDKKGQSWSY